MEPSRAELQKIIDQEDQEENSSQDQEEPRVKQEEEEQGHETKNGVKPQQLQEDEDAPTASSMAKSYGDKREKRRQRKPHSVVKSFFCEKCGRGFTQLGGLKRHKLIHSGVKQFECDQSSFTDEGLYCQEQLKDTSSHPHWS
ncbi:uncharacterized protein KZ484_007502 [Pholidichthys leucotaenia]